MVAGQSGGGGKNKTYRERADRVDGERVDLFVRHDGRDLGEEEEMEEGLLGGSKGFVACDDGVEGFSFSGRLISCHYEDWLGGGDSAAQLLAAHTPTRPHAPRLDFGQRFSVPSISSMLLTLQTDCLLPRRAACRPRLLLSFLVAASPRRVSHLRRARSKADPTRLRSIYSRSAVHRHRSTCPIEAPAARRGHTRPASKFPIFTLHIFRRRKR